MSGQYRSHMLRRSPVDRIVDPLICSGLDVSVRSTYLHDLGDFPPAGGHNVRVEIKME